MRAFVALVPPAGALAELDAAVARLRDTYPDLRWTPTAQWHLTLAFLGEIDESVLPDLGERLARAARRHPPTALILGEGSRFGDRVLWVRVRAAPVAEREFPSAVARLADLPRTRRSHERASPDDRVSTGRVLRTDRSAVGDLRPLAASVTAAARRCRIAVDERPYRPHLTLARGRPGVDLRPVAAALADFAGSPWTANSLHLVRSRLGAGPGGSARHEVVGTWPLGRAPGPAEPEDGTAGGA